MTRTLPRYTCTETVERQYFRGDARNPIDSCKKDNHLRLDGLDRFRLDVTVANNHEIFAWAGASRFDSRRVDEIVRQGPTSTGAFGTYLVEIFVRPGAQFQFLQKQEVDGRPVLEYSFRVPKELSHYGLGLSGHLHMSGYGGTFQIDPENLQLQRLDIQTDQLDPGTEMCNVETTLFYQRAAAGDSGFLLPAETKQSILRPNGEVHNARTTFAACHEYTAESVIRFGDEPGGGSSQSARNAQQAPLPEGLPVALALSEAIRSDTVAAGDAVAAKVLHNVTAQGSREVLIPSGATVRGRIIDMRLWLRTYSYFLISVNWQTVNIGGDVKPFSAKLDRAAESQKARLPGTPHGRGLEVILPPPGLHPDSTSWLFRMTGKSYTIQKDFPSFWLTTAASSTKME